MGNHHIHPDIILFFILLVFNLGIVSFVIYCRLTKKVMQYDWISLVKHVGQLGVAIGVCLLLMELVHALEGIETAEPPLTPDVIAGGLKSTLYSPIHGLFVYLFSLACYALFKVTERVKS